MNHTADTLPRVQRRGHTWTASGFDAASRATTHDFAHEHTRSRSRVARGTTRASPPAARSPHQGARRCSLVRPTPRAQPSNRQPTGQVARTAPPRLVPRPSNARPYQRPHLGGHDAKREVYGARWTRWRWMAAPTALAPPMLPRRWRQRRGKTRRRPPRWRRRRERRRRRRRRRRRGRSATRGSWVGRRRACASRAG